MLVQSLVNVIEAAVADRSLQRISGNIKDFDKLLTAENLTRLEQYHQGVFAFIAFHPAADKAVRDYICAGSLGADAGKYVLALFTLDSPAHHAKSIGAHTFENFLEIDEDTYPIYELVRSLFPGGDAPRLPGILLIEKLSAPTEAVFAGLETLKTLEEVRAACYRVFEIAAASYQDTRAGAGAGFADTVSRKLAQSNLDYRRSGLASMGEWLVKAFLLVRKHAGDIVSVVKLFK